MFSIRIQSFILLLILFAACKKEDFKIINLSDPYMGGRGIVLNWEFTEIPGFKYYQILRSTNGKDFYFCGDLRDINHNINHTTYTDILYPAADKIYYKVAAFGDEIIASNMVSIVVPKPVKLHFQPEATYIIPERSQILFFNSNENESYAYLFEYINNTLLDSINLSVPYNIYSLGFGDFPGNHEFYFNSNWNGEIKMSIYDIETLNKTEEFDFIDSNTDIITNKNNSIYFYDYNNIYIVNRATLNVVLYNKNGYHFDRFYYMENKNKLIGVGYDLLMTYDLDNSGNIISETAKVMNLPQESEYIEGTDYIYTLNYFGNILINIENSQEYNISDLCEGLEEVSCFHSKNNVLYLYGDRNIYCFSLPDLTFIEKIPTRKDPNIILSDDSDLFLFEFENGSETIIDKIKLTQ
jgi:hypothetical protein